MVSVLLLVLALGVFQLGLVLYVRNSVIAAASEGARNGARADATPAEGADRTASLITATLSEAFAEDVSAQERVVGGARVVEVTVVAPIPVIGLLGPTGTMTLTGRAFSERQVAVG
jgi:Flp pilus assembly protein TadG